MRDFKMSMDNQCIFIGRLGKDPEIKYTQSGAAIAELALAVDDKRKDQSGNWVKETVWVRCKAFGKTAELLQQYTAKGSQLALNCKYQTGKYTNQEGKEVYTHDFIVSDMKFLGSANSNQQVNNQQQPQQQTAMQAQAPQHLQNDFDDDVPF
jgi:single-strand DNA-binding protein